MVNRKYLVLAERVALTFVGAFIAVYFAAFSAGQVDAAFLKDPDLFNKAKTAGVAALIPLVSGIIGFKVGDKNSPSLVTVSNKKRATDGTDYTDQDVPMDSPAPVDD